MLGLLTGCAMFIGDIEHNARQDALLEDTSSADTDTLPNDYEGVYRGSIEIDLNKSYECSGNMKITVDPEGDLSGSGSCKFDVSVVGELNVELTGQVNNDEAEGKIRLNDSHENQWDGSFYTSSEDVYLRGDFGGDINLSNQSYKYTGSFEVELD
jgi:hypothetical protein